MLHISDVKKADTLPPNLIKTSSNSTPSSVFKKIASVAAPGTSQVGNSFNHTNVCGNCRNRFELTRQDLCLARISFSRPKNGSIAVVVFQVCDSFIVHAL